MHGYMKFKMISGPYRLRTFPALSQLHAQNNKGRSRYWHTPATPTIAFTAVSYRSRFAFRKFRMHVP